MDAETKSLAVQSASCPADLQYDLSDEELKKLTSNSLKEVPVADRLKVINDVIGKDFKDAVTMDMLNERQSISIGLTDQAKAELDQQLGFSTRQAGLEVRGDEIIAIDQENVIVPEYGVLDENTVNGRDIQDGKGWLREGAHGRAVDVQEIRVELVKPQNLNGEEAKQEEAKGKNEGAESEVKYRMTAVINGQTISHDITAKQYNKFLALDDEHRMKLFAKIFPEVDMKRVPREKDPNGLSFGQKLFVGLRAALGVAHEAAHIYNEVHGPRPDSYVTNVGHHLPPERVFFKPGVDSPMDVAARAYEAQVNAEIRHMEMHHCL